MAYPLSCFRLGVGACLVSQVGFTFYDLITEEISKTKACAIRLFDFLSSAFYFTQWAHHTGLIHLQELTFPLLTVSYSLIMISSGLHMRESFLSLNHEENPLVGAGKRQQELDFLMHILSVAFGAVGLGEVFLELNPAILSIVGTAWVVSWVVAKSHALHTRTQSL